MKEQLLRKILAETIRSRADMFNVMICLLELQPKGGTGEAIKECREMIERLQARAAEWEL